MKISSPAPYRLYAMSSSETGGSSGPTAQAGKVARRSAGDPALRLLDRGARLAVLLQRLGARQAQQVRAQSLEAPVRVEAHQQPDGRVGLVGERRLDEVAHPVHEHVERLDEQLRLVLKWA